MPVAPSGKIPLPPEAYAALGDFKSAIRELKRTQEDLRAQATQTLADKGVVDPAIKGRIAATQARIKEYRQQEDLRKIAAKEGKTSAAKTVASLLNTHNPHGALRSLFTGSASTGGTVVNLTQSAGRGLQALAMRGGGTAMAGAGTSLINSAASVAGPAALAAFIASKVMQLATHAAAQNEQNALRKRQLAGEELNFIRAQRFSSFYSGRELAGFRNRLEAARQRGRHGAQGFLDNAANAMGWTGDLSPEAEARGLEFQALEMQRVRMERRLSQIVGRKAAKRLLDPHNYMNDKDVIYEATDIRAIGIGERFKRDAVNSLRSNPFTAVPAFLLGDLLPNYDKEAIEKKAEEKAAKAGRSKIGQIEEWVEEWNNNPQNRATMFYHDRQLRQVQEFEIERAGQWNPY